MGRRSGLPRRRPGAAAQGQGRAGLPATERPSAVAVGPAGDGANDWPNPAMFFEFDGVNLNRVADPPNANTVIYTGRMLLLPTGEVLYAAGTPAMYAYQPDPGGLAAWKPTVTACPTDLHPGVSYTLSGTQLNGLSQAVSYGDDAQMATNYPLVRLRNPATGAVFYCRTFDHSTMGVATGAATVSTTFTVPAAVPQAGTTWRSSRTGSRPTRSPSRSIPEAGGHSTSWSTATATATPHCGPISTESGLLARSAPVTSPGWRKTSSLPSRWTPGGTTSSSASPEGGSPTTRSSDMTEPSQAVEQKLARATARRRQPRRPRRPAGAPAARGSKRRKQPTMPTDETEPDGSPAAGNGTAKYLLLDHYFGGANGTFWTFDGTTWRAAGTGEPSDEQGFAQVAFAANRVDMWWDANNAVTIVRSWKYLS